MAALIPRKLLGFLRDAMTGATAYASRSDRPRRAPLGPASVGGLVFAGLLLIAATSLGVATMVSRFHQHALASIERELNNTSLLLGRQIDGELGAVTRVENNVAVRVADAGVMSNSDMKLRVSAAELQQILRSEINVLPQIEALELISSDGSRIASTRTPVGSDGAVAGEDYFHALESPSSRLTYIGAPRRGPAGGWSMVLARKLIAPDGTFLGVVASRISLDYFDDLFSLVSNGSNSSYALFRDDGTLLARYPRISAAIGRRFQAGIEALRRDQGAIRFVGKMDDKDRLLAARHLENFPLFVSVGVEESAISSTWHKQIIFPATVGGLLALVIALFVFVIARERSRQNRRFEQSQALQKQRLDTAINNMTQGLLLFDADARIVLCNNRYVAMYNLSPDVAKPGCSLPDLLAHRQAKGSFDDDVETYCASVRQAVAQGKVTDIFTKTPDGRTIKVVNKPLAAGGWVATHEDITERQLAELERDRSRVFLNLIIEGVPVPIFVKSASERRYVLVNRAAEEFWGISRSEIIGCTARDIFPEPDCTLIAARDDESLSSGSILYSEREINTPRNGKRTAAVTRLTIDGDDGQPQYLVGVIRDATERRNLERERDQNLAFLNAVIEAVPVTIVVKDASTLRYALVNRAAEGLWGVLRGEVIGKTTDEIFPRAAADRITAHDMHLLEYKDAVCDETHEVETPGNGIRMVRTKKMVLPGEDGEPKYLLGVVEDVTESARASERIRYMAHHDLLTGLCNRALFMDKVGEALALSRRAGGAFAIFMLDLDRFKEVNDSLGHAAGDELLKEAARRLRGSVRETDTLARLGGDEFAVIQLSAEVSTEAASALAGRIIDIFREPFQIESNHVTVGVSIGISMAPVDGDDSNDLMKKADLALYRAKSEGRNGYSFFDASLATEAETRHHLERDLRMAILNDELQVHYQPIIDASTRKPCGAEALARWPHPQNGLVPPTQFIPLAEETGLIVPLGASILRKACAAAATWPPELKIAVNLSPLQFKKSNLVEVVTAALTEAGLAAERLELEITESVLIDEHLDVLRIIRQLKKLGVSIVLDDFGTGYSSLSYLTMFPFDKIKIDKTFTQNLTRRAECAAIVSAVRALAYSLNIAVVAEGVETEQQFELLRAAGVNAVQGYLFGKPCPLQMLRFDAPSTAKKRA